MVYLSPREGKKGRQSREGGIETGGEGGWGNRGRCVRWAEKLFQHDVHAAEHFG